MTVFAKGDIVSLRSGSPPMTISETLGTNSVVVVFFNSVSGKLERETIFDWVLRAGATAPTSPIGQR